MLFYTFSAVKIINQNSPRVLQCMSCLTVDQVYPSLSCQCVSNTSVLQCRSCLTVDPVWPSLSCQCVSNTSVLQCRSCLTIDPVWPSLSCQCFQHLCPTVYIYMIMPHCWPSLTAPVLSVCLPTVQLSKSTFTLPCTASPCELTMASSDSSKSRQRLHFT